MPTTVDHLRMKSENLVKGIETLVNELKNTNGEIGMQIQANESAINHAHANIEQLRTDNEELVALRADNEAFIAKVTEIILED